MIRDHPKKTSPQILDFLGTHPPIVSSNLLVNVFFLVIFCTPLPLPLEIHLLWMVPKQLCTDKSALTPNQCFYGNFKVMQLCRYIFFWTDFDLSRDLARLQQIRAAIWHWKHSFFFLKKEISCSYAQNHARRLCFALAKRNKINIRYICLFLIFINKIWNCKSR